MSQCSPAKLKIRIPGSAAPKTSDEWGMWVMSVADYNKGDHGQKTGRLTQHAASVQPLHSHSSCWLCVSHSGKRLDPPPWES